MATYSIGGTPSYAESIGLDTMMSILKDNASNEISAEDVRWSAFTLWDKIEGVSASIAEFTYTNPNPVTNTLGGINVGTTFSGITLTSLLDTLLYPYVYPTLNLVFLPGENPKEFGATPSVNVNYNIVKKTDTINTITLKGNNIVPPGVQPFDLVINANYNVGITQDVTTNIPLVINYGTGLTSSVSINSTWSNAVYVFGLSSVTSYDLTNDPGDATVIGSAIESTMNNTPGTNMILSDITSGQFTTSTLSVSYRKVLKTNRLFTYSTIGGGNRYIGFAWPTTYGTPAFEVNGLPNTAFTKVVNAKVFKNVYGYTASYDVWLTNTAQNSPLATIRIS